MYESIQNELNNKLSIAEMTGRSALSKADKATEAINQMTNVVTQGMSAYAQSTINKDKYEIRQMLIAGQDEYLDVDNENASTDYADWVNSKLDEYASSKGGFAKGYFSEYKQAFLDDARESFDQKLVTQIDSRNKLNALETWDNAIKAFTNGDDMALFEMKDVYKTTFGEGGLKVTHEKVNIDNLYDTESEDLSDREKSFNQLLNVLYESQCLVTDQDTAKAYVNSKITDIENSLIQNEIISMADEWSRGLDTGDGNIKHFTKNELAQELKSQYSTGFNKPYTGEKITATESQAYSNFIDDQVNAIYSKIYNENKTTLYTDADGFFAAQAAVGPVTSDVMYNYLEQKGMIERNSNGEVISHYGLDESTWLEIDQIAKTNDRIARADDWARNPRDINGDDVTDLADVDWDVRHMILKDSFGKYYVSSQYSYQSLDGSVRYSDSTVEALNRSGQSLESLSTSITQAVSSFVESGVLPTGIEIKSYNGKALPTESVSDADQMDYAMSIWYSYLTNAGYDDSVAKDLIEANKHNISLEILGSRFQRDLHNLPENVSYESFMARNTYKAGDINPVDGTVISESDAKKINGDISDRFSIYATQRTNENSDKYDEFAKDVSDLKYSDEYLGMDNLETLLAEHGLAKRDLGNYSEIESLAKENDNIALANALVNNGEVEINGNTYTYDNAPSYIKSLITESELADGSKVYSVNKQYSDLEGVSFFTSSYFNARQEISDKQREAREKAITDMTSLAEFMAWDNNSMEPPRENAVYKYYEELMASEYGENWESVDKYEKDMMMAKAFGDFSSSVSTSIAMSGDSSLSSAFSSMTNYLTDHIRSQVQIDEANAENVARFNAIYGSGAFEIWEGTPYLYKNDSFDASKAGAADYLSINKSYEYGDYTLIDMQIESELGHKLTLLELANIDELREATYKRNDVKIDDLCAQGYQMMDGDTQFASSGANARKKLESAYYYNDILHTEELAKTVENTQNYYINTLQQVGIIESFGYKIDTNYSYLGTDTANGILKIANENLVTSIEAQYGVNTSDLIGGIDTEALRKVCEEYGLNYDYEYNLACNYILSSVLASNEGSDIDSVMAMYNENATGIYKNNLESAYKTFETSTKANKLYDKEKIQLNSYEDIKQATNTKVNSMVAGSKDFKVSTSTSGWMDIVLQKINEGQSISYLKEWVKTSPYISAEDTEKFLKMANSDFFQKLTDNPELTSSVKDEASKIHNPVCEKYFWDAMFNSVTGMREGDDITETVAKAMSAYSMAYGEVLADNMFEFEEGSSVYGTPQFDKKGKALSDNTKTKIDEYAKSFYNHEFDAAGVPYLIDSYMRREGGIEKLRAELGEISGENVDNYCIVTALSALGEDVSMLNPDSETFANDVEKYFGRISKNSDDYDARYADHVLRVAGSFKSAFGLFSKETTDDLGIPVIADFGSNMYFTTNLSDNAISNGSYISFESDGSPVLNLAKKNLIDGSTSYQTIDLKYSTEEGREELKLRIEKELNELIKKGEVSTITNTAMVADEYGVYHVIPIENLIFECPSYKEYLEFYGNLRSDYELPDKVGIVWFNDTYDRLKVRTAHMEFIDGNINSEFVKYNGGPTIDDVKYSVLNNKFSL